MWELQKVRTNTAICHAFRQFRVVIWGHNGKSSTRTSSEFSDWTSRDLTAFSLRLCFAVRRLSAVAALVKTVRTFLCMSQAFEHARMHLFTSIFKCKRRLWLLYPLHCGLYSFQSSAASEERQKLSVTRWTVQYSRLYVCAQDCTDCVLSQGCACGRLFDMYKT
jgi:hypothetical protein